MTDRSNIGKLRKTRATFIIQQVTKCPHCNKYFDIIRLNHHKPRAISKTQVEQTYFDENGQQAKKIVDIDIPRPHYVGVFMENTRFPKGQEEILECPFCEKFLMISEVDWDYRISEEYRPNSIALFFRRLFKLYEPAL